MNKTTKITTEIGTYVPKIKGATNEEKLYMVSRAGFRVLCVKPWDVRGDNGVTEARAEKHGMYIENVHLTSDDSSFIWGEGLHGDEVIDRYIAEVKYYSSIGINTGIVHVTWKTVPPPPPISEMGLRRFARLIKVAEECRFKLAFENSASVEHLRYVLDNFDGEYVGFCFDSGHHNCFSPNEPLIADYGERLFAMHLQDNEGLTDLHIIPYDGCADWHNNIKELAKTKLFSKNIVFETVYKVKRERPGMSAADIRESLSGLSIINDERLLSIYDGGFEIYTKIGSDEFLERLYAAGERIVRLGWSGI